MYTFSCCAYLSKPLMGLNRDVGQVEILLIRTIVGHIGFRV